MSKRVKRIEPGIWKMDDGRYQITYYDDNNERHYQHHDRLLEARDAKAKIRDDKRNDEYIDPRLGDMRLRDYAPRWLEGKSNLRPRTEINIRGRLDNHILPTFGDMHMRAIQPAHVRAWVKSLTVHGLAASTVKATYLTFGQIMDTAAIDRVIAHSPCRGIDLPRESSHEEMLFLSPDQVRELAETITPRFRALIYTAAYTGMRAGELGALKVGRTNLLKRSLDVAESLSDVHGKLVTGPTKTGERRTVSLPAFLADMLGEHIGLYPSDDGYVFTATEGGPINHRNFYRRHFRPAVSETQLPEGLRFHDLRHTCASILIAQGWNAKQIQDRLGHSSIRTTLDRYGHLFEGHDAELLDKLDARFRDAQ